MNSAKKIIGRSKLKNLLARERRNGKTVAFTNGCFDLLHKGHVSYLEAAKKPNRILVVGLNSDASIRRIKGKKRPIVHESQRARVLAALQCVDYVTLFNEETPYNLIKALRPDVLIKGADWKGKKVVGEDLVHRTELIKYLKRFSTTNIIKAILRKCAK